VDFNELDGERLIIKDRGVTADDLRRHGIALKDGLKLTLFTLDGTDHAEVGDLVGVASVISDPALFGLRSSARGLCAMYPSSIRSIDSSTWRGGRRD
jgi:hypothetical protein